MCNFLRPILCLLALMLVTIRATAQNLPAKDFQQWTQIAANWQVKPRLTISTFGEIHIGNDVSQFDQEIVSAEVTYAVSKWVAVGGGYLYLHANPKLSGISYENRILGEVTFSAPVFHHLLLSDRVRPELRWEQAPSGGTFTQRYRNRVTLERPIRKYSPFVMWEKFYNANVEAWNRTRYYAGITRMIGARRSIQLYYMRQNDQFSRPFHKSALGASVMFNFGEAHGKHPHEDDVAVGFGGAGGYLEMNVYKPLMIFNITHSITIMTDGCENFRKFLVEGTQPNQKKIDEYVERSLMLVTALAPVIGYDKASKIAHYTRTRQKSEVESTPGFGFGSGFGWGYGIPYAARWRWGLGPDIWTHNYTQACVMVDIIDQNTKMLVWRGVAKDTVSGIDLSDKQANETAKDLVKRFIKDTRKADQDLARRQR